MNPNYQPLAEVQQKLRVEWYRCLIDSTKLRGLMKRNDLQGWFQAVGHLILLVGTGLLSYFLWFRKVWFGFAIAFFAHGIVASFFTGWLRTNLAMVLCFVLSGSINSSYTYIAS